MACFKRGTPGRSNKEITTTDTEHVTSDPFFQHSIEVMKRIQRKHVQQSQDPESVFALKKGFVDPFELETKYAHSPTAMYTIEAFKLYLHGWGIIREYKKSCVETDEDCKVLGEGFSEYTKGFIMVGHMQGQFPLPPITHTLLRQYHGRQPHDTFAEYLKLLFDHMFFPDGCLSPMERNKNRIRALEIFAHKIEPYKTQENEKKILFDVLYLLGSLYTITHQEFRATDCVQKCYNMNNYDTDAIYGLGYHYLYSKTPSKAISMLEKYLQLAPRCDKYYPEVHYLIGVYHASHRKDLRTANRFYELGKQMEKYQLPFNLERNDHLPCKALLELNAKGIELKGLPQQCAVIKEV